MWSQTEQQQQLELVVSGLDWPGLVVYNCMTIWCKLTDISHFSSNNCFIDYWNQITTTSTIYKLIMGKKWNHANDDCYWKGVEISIELSSQIVSQLARHPEWFSRIYFLTRCVSGRGRHNGSYLQWLLMVTLSPLISLAPN